MAALRMKSAQITPSRDRRVADCQALAKLYVKSVLRQKDQSSQDDWSTAFIADVVFALPSVQPQEREMSCEDRR